MTEGFPTVTCFSCGVNVIVSTKAFLYCRRLSPLLADIRFLSYNELRNVQTHLIYE